MLLFAFFMYICWRELSPKTKFIQALSHKLKINYMRGKTKKRCIEASLRLLFVSLCFIVAGMTVYAQQNEVMVSGTVLAKDDGQPLPGASIQIKGTSKGVVSDFDGNFSLRISSGERTLIISYVGFVTKEITLTGKQEKLRIILESEANTLEEVVVMGSGVTQSRKEIGNAITVLKAEEIVKVPAPDLITSLQGKIPGAQITQNSGDPAGGFSIRLRGPSTISGSSEPLYIIDGVVASNLTTNVTNLNVVAGSAQPGQNRMADFNPNDIASMNILNGSAAAAIYGSRASNGVVIINTHKGQPGAGAPKFTFKSAVKMSELRKKVDVNLRGEQFVSGLSDRLWTIYGMDSSGNLTPYENLSSVKFDVTRYDYQDQVFRTGFGTENHFAMTGGGKNIGYNASVGYSTNEGIIKNTEFNRISARLGYTHKVADWLTYSAGLYYANSQSKEKPDGNVFWSPINSMNITNNIYDITRRDANGNLMAVEATRINPLSIIETFDINQKISRIIPNLKATLTPFSFMTIEQTLGLDSYSQKGHIFIPSYPYAGVNPSFFDKGYLGNAKAEVFNWNYDAIIKLIFNLSSDLKSETNLGYNFQSSKVTMNGTQGRDLDSNNQPTVPLRTLLSDVQMDIFGFFLQESLSYKGRYFLTLAGRLDGATNFDPKHRTNFYPKISGSYLISDENFWQNSKLKNIFNSFRLRSSFGEAGNLTAISPYERFGRYIRGDFFGENNVLQQEARLGNLDLKPERTREFEVGFDLHLFNNRAGIMATYYNQDISDLIVSRVLAPSEGGLTRTENVGSMENKGFETAVYAVPIQTTDWKWDININFSQNRNKVIKTIGGPISIATVSGAAPRVIEGEPLGVFYGTYYARNQDGSLLLNAKGLPQLERGNAQTNEPSRDATGQPTGDILRKIIGNPNPDYILGLGTSLSYKNLSFYMLWESVNGFDVFDADKRTRQGVGVGKMAEQELTGELPRGYIAAIYPIEEFRIEDGSFVKLREVSLSYDFGAIFKGIESLKIAISGRNLLSIDNFFSYDPETNAGGQSNILRSVNFGNSPIPRTFSFSVTANF